VPSHINLESPQTTSTQIVYDRRSREIVIWLGIPCTRYRISNTGENRGRTADAAAATCRSVGRRAQYFIRSVLARSPRWRGRVVVWREERYGHFLLADPTEFHSNAHTDRRRQMLFYVLHST